MAAWAELEPSSVDTQTPEGQFQAFSSQPHTLPVLRSVTVMYDLPTVDVFSAGGSKLTLPVKARLSCMPIGARSWCSFNSCQQSRGNSNMATDVHLLKHQQSHRICIQPVQCIPSC